MRLSIEVHKMAQFVKFSIFFTFAFAGLGAFGTLPLAKGIPLGVTLVVVGIILGQLVFKRLAKPEQVKKDLENRLKQGDGNWTP